MLQHRAYTPNFCFHFTGKELDSETGYSYFGARYLDHELTTAWLSVDPMADKYPSISPYAYCAWNPVKLVDPNGKDVYIIGDERMQKEALRQMQQKSQNMTFSIDKNGRLSFEGQAITEREKYMAGIIQSENVHVRLTVQDNSFYHGAHIEAAGGFGGNVLSVDKKTVTAYQVLDVMESRKLDKQCNNNGNLIWHEISEAYEGGLISLKKGINAPAAFDGNDKTIFDEAHFKAGRFFPGTISSYEEEIPESVRSFNELKTMREQSTFIACPGVMWMSQTDNTITKHKYTR
jgi:RHS repeat-associated protein